MKSWCFVVSLAMLPGSNGCKPRRVQPGARPEAESLDGAARAAPGNATTAAVAVRATATATATATGTGTGTATATATATGPVALPAASAMVSVESTEPRIVRFAWRPPGGDEAAYAMSEPEDQHRIVIFGRGAAARYPVLVALHGQPKRGQRPRGYSFLQTVIEVTRDLERQGRVGPLVLALPVFRFEGLNWPAFDLVAFRAKIEEVLAAEGLVANDFYVVGHSGAAGCGGDGMNRAHRVHPVAVGFFDTCLGSGFRNEVRALQRARVPTSILQSVETAGVQPRRLREYDGRYDFGQVYRTIGLVPVACPVHLPEAPLRSQPYRCAADADGLVQAFVVDTGEGEEAHNALIGVALRYFLRAHLLASP